MKTTDLKKLYAQLSHVELANLAFEAIARQDESETTAITRCMPKAHCLLNIGTGFNKRLTELTNVSLFYGLVFYRELTNSLRAFESEVGQSTCPEFQARIEGIGSMRLGMSQVCEQLKIDIHAVEKTAMIEHEPDFREHAQPDKVEYWRNLFMSGFE